MGNLETSIRGRINKRRGEFMENQIEDSLRWYRNRGLAEIEKTPEPMRVLSGMNAKGQFEACFEKRAQPDFKGTLKGGRSVVFESKHTDSDRISQNVVTADQWERLDKHEELGAVAFVLVGMKSGEFYRVPWGVWKDMKRLYGYKHMKRSALQIYRVPFVSGVIKLLDGLVE